MEVSLSRLKKATFFPRIDANAGFNQIKLAKESIHLSTLITPFGRFMSYRLPFGINCASYYFSKKFCDLLHNIPNVISQFDVVLIFAETMDQHNATLRLVCERLADEEVTLN